MTITRPNGQPMAGALVRFTLADGGIEQMTTPSSGVAVVDTPPVRVDVTRPYNPATGDPVISTVDALNVLRISVGLAPSFGPAQARDFIAADINQDGLITSADALAILRLSVGQPSTHSPTWIFVDADLDLTALNLSRMQARVDQGISLPPDWDGGDLAMTGILLGSVNAQT